MWVCVSQSGFFGSALLETKRVGSAAHLDHTAALSYSPDDFKQVGRFGHINTDTEVGLLLIHQSEKLLGGRIRVERDAIGVTETGFRGACLSRHFGSREVFDNSWTRMLGRTSKLSGLAGYSER